MSRESLTLAHGGRIYRIDYCSACGGQMSYRVKLGSEIVQTMFCGNLTGCTEALKAFPPPPPPRPTGQESE